MQNTGNPVLDSVVNLLEPRQGPLSGDLIKQIHAAVLEIAAKEPGGLKRSADLAPAAGRQTNPSQ